MNTCLIIENDFLIIIISSCILLVTNPAMQYIEMSNKRTHWLKDVEVNASDKAYFYSAKATSYLSTLFMNL